MIIKVTRLLVDCLVQLIMKYLLQVIILFQLMGLHLNLYNILFRIQDKRQ